MIYIKEFTKKWFTLKKKKRDKQSLSWHKKNWIDYFHLQHFSSYTRWKNQVFCIQKIMVRIIQQKTKTTVVRIEENDHLLGQGILHKILYTFTYSICLLLHEISHTGDLRTISCCVSRHVFKPNLHTTNSDFPITSHHHGVPKRLELFVK